MPPPLATAPTMPVETLPALASTDTDTGGADGAGAAAGGSGTGTGAGIGAGGGTPALLRAVWLHAPTSEEMRTFWPAGTLRDRISAKVLLACDVPVPGVPRRCLVVSERPRHFGFGEAAVRMSSLFPIKPLTRGGEVAYGWVLVPLTFSYERR